MTDVRQPRVLVLSDLWPPFPGGAERLAFNLSRHLLHHGMDVQVWTGYEHPQQFDGPPVQRTDMFGVFDTQPLGAAFVRDLLGAVNPDVVLTHHLYAHQYADVLAASGVPFVQVVLNGERIPAAEFAVYISDWVRNQHHDAQAQDMTIVPPAMPDVVAPEHGQHIGFIKPIHHKGVDLVYRLAHRLPHERFLVLRGEWQDLEIISDLPNVVYLDPVADMREFWGQVRMVLAPSLSEDAGTVGQEAALNGVPCRSSDSGGHPQNNAGGIELTLTRMSKWVRAIRALDQPSYYDRVVQEQRRAYDAHRIPALLDEFADKVQGAAWTRS